MGVARRSSPAAMSGWGLFALCAAFRVVNAFVVRTFFNADEYWQSLEVAHRMVFGYGYLTWEWERGLRGYAHPAMFAALYKLAATLGVDTTPVLVWSPRVLQALVAAAADVHTHRLALRWFGDDLDVARWALFCSLACWFNFFCAVRTFSNCTEAALTTAALSYWPWRRRRPAPPTKHTSACASASASSASASSASASSATSSPFVAATPEGEHRVLALVLAAAACVIRPTAALYWLPLALTECVRAPASSGGWFRFAIGEAAPVGAVALAAAACVDRLFYGAWTLVPWNFVRFNLLERGSAAYGAHPWHWYLTQGAPVVATVFLPLAVLGCVRAGVREPAVVGVWTILGHSLVAHKEFRFLMPALPSALTAAGAGLARLRGDAREKRRARRFGAGTVASALALATQAPAAAYLSTWHQSGTLAVMPEIVRAVDRGEVHSGGVLFATPCHQTPFHSHVHRPDVRMDFLKCPPSDDGAPDEADRFWDNPGAFLEARYGRAPGEEREEASEGEGEEASEREGEETSEREGEVTSEGQGEEVSEGWGSGASRREKTPPPGSGSGSGSGSGASRREKTPAPSHVVAYDSTVSSRPGFEAWLSRWKFRRVVDVHHAHFAVDREKQGRVWMFARPRPERDEDQDPLERVVEGASARDENAGEL
jgi:phosphatidylinositol glycan class B